MIAVPPSKRLGLRIQSRRRQVGFRFAKDLAAAMGWNASMLSRVENGERGLNARDVEQLRRHLEVDEAWFFEGDDDEREPLLSDAMVDFLDGLIARRREEIEHMERMRDLLRRQTQEQASRDR